VKAGLAFAYLVVLLFIAFAWGYSPESIALLLPVLLWQVLASQLLWLRGVLSGLQAFRWDARLSIADRTVAIVLLAPLLYFPIFKHLLTIHTFAWLQVASAGLAVAFGYGILLRQIGAKTGKFNLRFAKGAFVGTAPFALLTLVMAFHTRLDVVLLERLRPDGALQAGYYAAAYRLLDAANMLPVIAAGMLLPRFAYLLKNREPLAPLQQKATFGLLGIALLVALVSMTLRVPIMQKLYPGLTTVQLPTLFMLSMFTFIPMSGNYVFGTLLTAARQMRVLIFIALGGVAVNGGLNLWLIPGLGAMGAAYAALATQGCLCVAQALAARRLILKTA
jgi:O-antigen/teichoic acid export membrane protein